MGPLRQAMQQEPTTELLTQAAEPPSPGPAQPVAACSHGPSAGAVCSSNCRPDVASAAESPPVRGHNDQTSQGEPPLCPALSLSAFSCPGPGRSAAPARPFRRLPGRFHECSCVPDASVLLCADSQGHQPTMQAMKPSLSSLRVVRVAEHAHVSGRLPWPQRWLPQCFPEVSGKLRMRTCLSVLGKLQTVPRTLLV
jgi:hypothetical protein